MPTYTTNYNLAKPLVNSAVDQDLWGTELNSDMDIIDSTMKTNADAIAALGQTLYPVGSVYMNKTVSTNPATLFGFGTWVAITDKFIVARGSTYTSTGGAATVTLTTTELPSHSHLMFSPTSNNSQTKPSASDYVTVEGNAANDSAYIITESASSGSEVATLGRTTATGSGAAFSIIPPYQAVYMWERTA